ncbi:YcjF family protein [Cyanobium sp. WAJ14-Wanaka]|uniref:YcjF family protein n=1 Tax=Cyanobium sp. WAJ14-Wanaka TaxID=2823725 RepID=UPI0020CD6C36|nr:DUF697 domain-containing protein [Cyanobium sp. WAJ14-Wanaka]MCP9774609.1 DUF697 domain-containing protein [Cyanobium sp. WAJ14-Wanaka]
MKLRTRLWLIAGLAVAALVGLGMVLQLVNQLTWQLSSFLPYGLVGPVMAIIFLGVVLLVAQLAWPWITSAINRRNGRQASARPPTAANTTREAAKQNLEAIEQTLERVRDAVEREALKQERERMQEELERGDLVIVVFGAGSSGKTSLIRALLRELVGKVGAAMGSTDQSQRYRLRLKGLQRAVWLVDTPGILEAGSAGHERERLSRQQASKADLLLLVVDGDLRAAEMEVFTTLAELGKRLILVLNKCDLRGEREEQRLLELLRERSRGKIESADVIPASAAPQSLPMPGARPLQPAPEVEALLVRIAAVLHADGENLIADNLLLQCRQLNQSSRDLLAEQRRRDGEVVVDRNMWIGAGVLAITPIPGIDLLGAAAVNAQMAVEIAKIYGISLSRQSAQELALSVGRTLAGLGLVKGGVGLITAAMSLNLPALVLSRAIQAITAAWLTRVAGLSFITYFERDQDWGDGGVAEVVRQHYDLSRREGVLKRFLEVAFNRVVEPLSERERQLPPRPPQD